MAFRDEIIRGIRLAAIVFSVLLVGLIGYRMLHGAPVPNAPPKPLEMAGPAAPEIPKAPDPVAVPPPPAAPSTASRKKPTHRAPTKETLPIQAAPIIRNADADPPPQVAEEIPLRTVMARELNVPEMTPQPVEEVTVTAEPVQEKSGNRSKRALHAVGRFLHIGK